MMNSNDMLSLNPGLFDLLACAKRPFNRGNWSYKRGPQPLVLGHLSDIHADQTELARTVALREALGAQVEDFICTGDLMDARFCQSMDYWMRTPGAEHILTIIGNHDVLADATGFDFSHRVSQQAQYAQYFEPFIACWGVRHEVGKTYYYKDYPKNNIRLIAINVMLENADNEEQLAWFGGVLQDALAQKLTVVCAAHYPPVPFQAIPCNFTTLDSPPHGAKFDDRYYASVDEFMQSGGDFVCWLTGHNHQDMIGVHADYPHQLAVVVGALSMWQSDFYTDLPRTAGTVFQDLLNLTAIDTSSHLLQIIRIGSNRDRYLRSRKLLTINYQTAEILWQE